MPFPNIDQWNARESMYKKSLVDGKAEGKIPERIPVTTEARYALSDTILPRQQPNQLRYLVPQHIDNKLNEYLSKGEELIADELQNQYVRSGVPASQARTAREADKAFARLVGEIAPRFNKIAESDEQAYKAALNAIASDPRLIAREEEFAEVDKRVSDLAKKQVAFGVELAKEAQHYSDRDDIMKALTEIGKHVLE
jgi:hypothetical protein